MSINLAAMKADTVDIVTDWDEELVIVRDIVAYGSAGAPTRTWATVDTYDGDWQPADLSKLAKETRDFLRLEAGENVQIKWVCYFAFTDNDIEEGDQIYRADGTYAEVKRVNRQECHVEVLLTEVKNEGGA